MRNNELIWSGLSSHPRIVAAHMYEHNSMGVAMITSHGMIVSSAENIFGLILLLISQSYILNISESCLKNESTMSISASGIPPKLIKATLD